MPSYRDRQRALTKSRDAGNPLVWVRLTAAHKAALKAAARHAGTTMSEFIRQRLIDGVYLRNPAETLNPRTLQPTPKANGRYTSDDPEWRAHRREKRQANSERYHGFHAAQARASLNKLASDTPSNRTFTDKPPKL